MFKVGDIVIKTKHEETNSVWGGAPIGTKFKVMKININDQFMGQDNWWHWVNHFELSDGEVETFQPVEKQKVICINNSGWIEHNKNDFGNGKARIGDITRVAMVSIDGTQFLDVNQNEHWCNNFRPYKKEVKGCAMEEI